MNIVVFGNTNNYPYLLAQALREGGHNVHLLVNRREILHRPESVDAGLLDGYPEWISDVSHIPDEDFVAQSERLCDIVNRLNSAQGLIVNHIGPSLLDLVDRPAIALMTGSDISHFANFATIEARQAGWEAGFRRSHGARLSNRLWSAFIQRQRAGILASVGVSYLHRGLVPEDDAILDGIGVPDDRRFFVYMANVPAALPVDAGRGGGCVCSTARA